MKTDLNLALIITSDPALTFSYQQKKYSEPLLFHKLEIGASMKYPVDLDSLQSPAVTIETMNQPSIQRLFPYGLLQLPIRIVGARPVGVPSLQKHRNIAPTLKPSAKKLAFVGQQ